MFAARRAEFRTSPQEVPRSRVIAKDQIRDLARLSQEDGLSSAARTRRGWVAVYFAFDRTEAPTLLSSSVAFSHSSVDTRRRSSPPTRSRSVSWLLR